MLNFTDGSLQLSASSAALDLALSQSPTLEAQAASTPLVRHRLSEQLVPSSTFNATFNSQANGTSSINTQKSPDTFGNNRQLNRHSMEASLAAYSNSSLSGQRWLMSLHAPLWQPFTHPTRPMMYQPLRTHKFRQSTSPPPKSHAQQHFHNHNASLGRIPPNAINNRHSRELSGGDNRRDEQLNSFQQLSSALQASAAPFSQPATLLPPSTRRRARWPLCEPDELSSPSFLRYLRYADDECWS